MSILSVCRMEAPFLSCAISCRPLQFCVCTRDRRNTNRHDDNGSPTSFLKSCPVRGFDKRNGKQIDRCQPAPEKVKKQRF